MVLPRKFKNRKLPFQTSLVLIYFEGNLINICQKAIKAKSCSSRDTSNVLMFRYHVIKLNEV